MACFELLFLLPFAVSALRTSSDSTSANGCSPSILPSQRVSGNAMLQVLLVGNGVAQDLGPELEQVAKAAGIWFNVKVMVKATSSFNLTAHMTAAQACSTPLQCADYFPPGFDAVILQEQSQTPGFFDDELDGGGHPDWVGSVNSVRYFAEALRNKSLTMGLLQGWGYANGDVTNSHIYPTYDTMQNLLTKGARVLEATARGDAKGGRVHVVPVGEVFRRVHERDAGDFKALYSTDQAKVRLGTWGDFKALYSTDQAKARLGTDDSHLSKDGNWLAAAVLLRSLTGARPNITASGLRARLLRDVPDGPGPCDGNPRFSSEDFSGAATLKLGALTVAAAILAWVN